MLLHEKKKQKELKNKVLCNAENLYNKLYYIYKDKCNKEINSLDTKNKKKLDYKKLRLSYYKYLSEEDQEEQEEQKEQEEQEEQEKTKTDIDKFSKYIAEKETDINEELSTRHFGFQKPSDIFNSLIDTNDIEKSNKLVVSITGVLKEFKEEINKMSEQERKIEKPDKIVEIVKEILKFNKQKQEGQGIKILTPNQMLSRLPIPLAQLQAGNNTEKLKNEMRQLLYSLYRSKDMTKQVYNNLTKHI